MDDYSKHTHFCIGTNSILMDYSYSTMNVVVRIFIFVFILFVFTAILLGTAINWRTANLNGRLNNNSLKVFSDSSSEVSIFFLEPVEFVSDDDERNELSLPFNYYGFENKIPKGTKTINIYLNLDVFLKNNELIIVNCFF